MKQIIRYQYIQFLLIVIFAEIIMLLFIFVPIRSDFLVSNNSNAITYQADDRVQVLLTTLQDKPNDVQLLNKLGNIYYEIGKFDESAKAYQKALDIDPELKAAAMSYAHLLRYRGAYQEAEKIYLNQQVLYPNDPTIYIELGKLYRNWQKYEEAESMFNSAILLDPENDSIYGYGLGYLYRDMGRYQDAEKAFKKALEIDPSNSFNYQGLGDLYRHIQNYDESEAMLKRSIEIDPKSEAYMGLGWLYLEQRQLDLAEDSFNQYLEVHRPKSEIYLGLGHIYLQRKEFEKAEEMYLVSIELNPTLGGYDSLVNLYNSLGMYDKAEIAAQKSLNN